MDCKRKVVITGCTLVLSLYSCLSQTPVIPSQSFEKHMRQAGSFLNDNKPEQAIPELQAAINIDASSVEAQADLGVLLYFQGKYSDAIPHLRAAVEKQPSLTKLQGLLGIAEIRTLNFAQAVGDLEASVPLLQDRKFKAEAGLELAGLYGQMGDLEKAAVLLDKLHKQLPDHTEILYASYRTYADLAGQSMLELSMTAPDSAQMHQIMAHEETRQGNTAGAIKQYRLAIAADPHLPGVHFELGELLSTSTDASLSAMAEEEYRTALAANPLDNKAERKLAEWHAKQGKFEAAKQEYERAVALQPNDADATLGLAEMLLDMDQANDALALFERTVQLEPTSATAHYQLGRLYWKKGRTEEAKQQTELYRKYKEMKDKLRTLYHEMRLHPGDLRAEDEERK